MSSSYTDFSASKPSGSSSGPTTMADANSNDIALWYAVVIGGAKGYALSVSGGTAEEPTTMLWTNGTQRVRATNTWTSGNLTQQVWDVSQDSGATYANVCTQTFTYDGSGNLTTTTNSGGMLDWLKYLLGKVKSLLTNFNTHTAATGTAVHGLGSVATQSAASVAITGGTINGTTVGVSTPQEGRFARAFEQLESLAPGAGAGATWDMTKGGTFMTNNGTNAVTFSGSVPAAYVCTHFFDVSNFNNTTFPGSVGWGVAGKPSIAGRAQGTLVSIDGGTNWTGSVSTRFV